MSRRLLLVAAALVLLLLLAIDSASAMTSPICWVRDYDTGIRTPWPCAL